MGNCHGKHQYQKSESQFNISLTHATLPRSFFKSLLIDNDNQQCTTTISQFQEANSNPPKDTTDLSHLLTQELVHDSVLASEVCFETIKKIIPIKKETLKRQMTLEALISLKQQGILKLIEQKLRFLQCKNCSVEEIVISIKAATSNILTHNITLDKLIELYSVYYWVANYIMYDVAAWTSLINKTAHPNVSCEYVLEHRLTVCNGYSNVFSAIANEMGYTAILINGHFRISLCDQNHFPPSFFTPDGANTHSWNAVQLEGVWFFVDCTYGSGILSEGCFMSKFISDYFFIPPEQLIFSHWPDDKQWQLLENPVCLSELQPLQVLSPCSLNLCVIRTQYKELLKIDSNATEPVVKIELSIPSDKIVIATISDWPEASNKDGAGTDYDYRALVYVDRKEGGKVTVYAIAHDQGFFQLKMFIKNCCNEYDFLCSYLISCEISSNHNLGFPIILSYNNNFSLINWINPMQRKYHVAECLSGEMSLVFNGTDIATISHYITNALSPQTKYHNYTAIHNISAGHDLWKLHIVFPTCGVWTICISSRENDKNEVPILIYEVHVLKIKPRKGYLSYPWIQNNLVDILHSEPIITNGDEMISIRFRLKQSIEFYSYIKDSDRPENEYRHYTNLIATSRKNEYEMQLIIPEPGRWFVYLVSLSQIQTHEEKTLFSCYFDMPDCLQNKFFPIVDEAIANKYQIKHQSILEQSETSEFRMQIECIPSANFQTQFYKGWSPERSEDNSDCMKIDHSATVHTINNSKREVHVIFPEPGDWTLLLTVFRADCQTVERVLILNLKSVHGENFRKGLFYKTFPSFHCKGKISVIANSNLYDFEIRDNRELSLDLFAPYKSIMDCRMFKVNDPSSPITDHCMIASTDTGRFNLRAVFPSIGEWCIQLFCCKNIVLQTYYVVHKAKGDVSYPWMHDSFISQYHLTILHPTLLLPSILNCPATFSFNIHKPYITELIHEASVNEKTMKGATQLLPVNNNQYKFVTNMHTSGSWKIRIFAKNTVKMPSKWTLVLSHSVCVH